MSAAEIARRVLVSGHVQGVSFRWATVKHARLLGVRGWVRNLPDGRVEAHVAGAPEAVEDLIGWMRRGPSRARVERVDVSGIAADTVLPGAFEQR